MSLYYKFKFVSPDALYSEVKEMLSSYFNSGVIDDVLFPKWTEHCLKRLGKTQYPIKEAVLEIDGYEACLPEDFNSVRELWACSVTFSNPIQSPSSVYYQKDCRIDPIVDSCHECFEPQQDCTTNFMVVHKTTGYRIFSFSRTCLLKPGNMNAKNCCGHECANMYAQTSYTFDIINGKIVTNIPSGNLHLIYYADNDDYQLIPDNFFLEDYIRKYLIYMCFLQISNQVTDETFNQVQIKLAKSEQDKNIAFVTATNELKKDTIEDAVRKIGYRYRNFNRRYRL